VRTKSQPSQVRLLLLLAFLPVNVSFCQQIPKAAKHFQAGLELEKAHKYHEAAVEFSQAIQINPEFSAAYYHLGFNALQDGDSEGAIRALMQLTQLEPNNNQARKALGQIYYGLGYYNDALALYFRAQQQSPDDPEIYFYIGLISFQQKAYSQATQALRHAILLSPPMIKARELLASVYEAQNDLPSAYKELREAAEIAPQSPGPPSDLGMLCLKEAKLTDAEEQFLHALSLQKDFVPARMGLAKTYRLMDRLPESLEQLSAVLKEEPEDPSALLERGTVENMLGKKADARADFEHFSQAAPDRAEGELFLGKLDSDAGQYNSAIPHLQKAIALDANQADAYFYLGQADYRLGKSEEAKEALQHCLSLDPVNKAASQLLEQALKASPQAR